MRAVVQRVLRAEVAVSGQVVGRIGRGLCVFVGVGREDSATDAAVLAEKVVGLRVFEDSSGRMNLGLGDVGGAVLGVSQFTLYGDVRRGKRPSFIEAMQPESAQVLFDAFCDECRRRGVAIETGRFRAEMEVSLVNDGPVTILIDTSKAF